jgi:putative transposase
LGCLAARRYNHGSTGPGSLQSSRLGLPVASLIVIVNSDALPPDIVSLAEVLPEAFWQRCYAHFLRNALDYLPRKVNDDCLTELRWFYDRRNVEEPRRDLIAWLGKWQAKYPKLCKMVEGNIEETFTFYRRLPKEHHKHLKSTKYARTPQPGAQAPDPCDPDLS